MNENQSKLLALLRARPTKVPKPRKPAKKRPTLTAACEWIARNDNSGNDDCVEEIESYLSVALIADLFGVEAASVAKRIGAIRVAEGYEVGDAPHV